MKRSELFFNFILIPVDIAMIVVAFISAYYFRIKMEVIYIWPFDQYIKFVLIMLPLWIIIFFLAGLYNYEKRKRPLDEFASIVLGVSSCIMLMVAWIFLSRTIFFSRLVIIYAWLFSLIFITFGRLFVRYVQIFLYRWGIGVHKVIILGNGEASELMMKEIQSNKQLGYKLIGIVNTKKEVNIKQNSKTLGDIESLEKITSSRDVDDVILTDSSIPEKQIVSIIDICHDKKIIFKQIPNLFQVQTANINIASLATIPIIEYRITPLEGWGRIIKRISDIIGSIVGIVIFSPLMIITAILIKFDSKGPIFYKNERVGESGKRFFVYKFRSMKIDCCTGNMYGGSNAEKYESKLIQEKSERSGPVYKVLHDPRRTKIGRFIEKTSIDEIPQFFNVFMGHMSIVGPRPHQPREVANYKSWHRKVLRIKPGISGMAQISGRSDLDFDDEARLDIYYIENWSLWLDAKIMIKTPLAVFKPRKAV